MKQLNSLTSFRGLAALYVVGFHIWLLGGANFLLSPFLAFGWSGVGFFFVLSGYLLVKKWIDGDYNGTNGKPSLRKFYTYRVFRTWPLYYFILIVDIFILGVYQFRILSFFYLQEYVPSSFDSMAFWTLAIE